MFLGKTHWVSQLLYNAHILIDKPFDYIVWFYGEENDELKRLEQFFDGKLVTVHGLPENLDIYINKNKRGLLCFDDLMSSVSESKQLTALCAYKTQHCNISWIILLQNLFHGGKERLNLYRCAHYITIFNSVLDRSQIYHLAHRILPGRQKSFLKIFEAATDRPHGYLFIDGRQNTPVDARFRTDILNGVYQRILVPE